MCESQLRTFEMRGRKLELRKVTPRSSRQEGGIKVILSMDYFPRHTYIATMMLGNPIQLAWNEDEECAFYIVWTLSTQDFSHSLIRRMGGKLMPIFSLFIDNIQQLQYKISSQIRVVGTRNARWRGMMNVARRTGMQKSQQKSKANESGTRR